MTEENVKVEELVYVSNENEIGDDEDVIVADTNAQPNLNIDPSKIDDLSNDTINIPNEGKTFFDQEENIGNEFEEEENEESMNQGSEGTTNTRNSRKTSSDKESSRIKVEKMPEYHREFGTNTDPDMQSAIQLISVEEEENKNWREIKQFVKDGEIVWGIVSGVQKGLSEQISDGLFCVVTLPKYPDMQVIIDENDYWMPTQEYGNSYKSMSDEQKFAKRQRTMTYQVGARIPMLLINAQRTRVHQNGYDNWQTPYTYVIRGSRVKAMELLQNLWFFNSNANRPKLNESDVYFANVLQVRKNAIKVECCGVESYISAYEASGKRVVDDCTKYFKNGDKLNVRISRLHIHEKGKPILDRNGNVTGNVEKENYVYLSVSGRLYDRGYTPKAISTITVGSSHLGQVASFNRKSHVYSVSLKNGVLAAVHASRLVGVRYLDRGDRVLVTVEEILDTYVRGRAMRI